MLVVFHETLLINQRGLLVTIAMVPGKKTSLTSKLDPFGLWQICFVDLEARTKLEHLLLIRDYHNYRSLVIERGFVSRCFLFFF